MTSVIREAAAELGFDLGHQPVEDAGAAVEAAAGLAGFPAEAGFGDHDRDERFGADRRPGQAWRRGRR